MLKKNMRKRLLAGALATIMALTMCPTWALAVDEDINTLPAPEGQMPAVDSTPAEDTIQTPDAGTQGQTEPKDTEQAGSLKIRILHRHHPAVRTSRILAIIAVPMKMILRIMMQ